VEWEADLKLFKEIWYSRNPAHEINYDTGVDMFWATAELVAREYIARRLEDCEPKVKQDNLKSQLG
jgi:hypothetical protein